MPEYGTSPWRGRTVRRSVLVTEQVTSGANSWIPVAVDIASGTRLAVQVDHSEVGSVDCRASIAYDA